MTRIGKYCTLFGQRFLDICSLLSYVLFKHPIPYLVYLCYNYKFIFLGRFSTRLWSMAIGIFSFSYESKRGGMQISDKVWGTEGVPMHFRFLVGSTLEFFADHICSSTTSLANHILMDFFTRRHFHADVWLSSIEKKNYNTTEIARVLYIFSRIFCTSLQYSSIILICL